MITCPNCGKKLSLFKVKNSFRCPECQSSLKSNTTFAALAPLILGGFIATPISERIFDNGIYVYALDILIVLGIFLLLWPILLKIKLADDKTKNGDQESEE